MVRQGPITYILNPRPTKLNIPVYEELIVTSKLKGSVMPPGMMTGKKIDIWCI